MVKYTHEISDGEDVWWAAVVDGRIYLTFDRSKQVRPFNTETYLSVEHAYSQYKHYSVRKLNQFKGNK